MKLFHLFFALLLAFSTPVFAQRISKEVWKQFRIKEDSLRTPGFNIVNGDNDLTRMYSDSFFTRILVRTLQMKHSFFYPLDSLETISKIYAPDSSFRIFTWHLVNDDYTTRQRGFIQLQTKDGSLRLFPLRDVSESFTNTTDTITGSSKWIGAVYYQMIKKSYKDKHYYTLIGYDENNASTTRKWIDVLSFQKDSTPVFGARNIFSFKKDSIVKKPISRFVLEYNKNGKVRMRYDAEMDMIIYDHLVSLNDQPTKKETLVPDGDYEGFVWEKGTWMHIDKIFYQSLEDGQAPVPAPFKEKKLPNTKEDE